MSERTVSAKHDMLLALTGGIDASVPEVLAARARLSGDRPFLFWGDAEWTYGQAWHEATRFAGWLERLAVAGPEFRVGAYLHNCPELLWSWFGALAASSVFVPLNREHRGPVLEDMISRARLDLVITDRSGLERLPRGLPAGCRVWVVDDPAAGGRPGYVAGPEAHDVQRATTYPDPFALAELMYTSGSTGRSKAARLPHNMLCRGGARFAEACGLHERDVFHAWLPLFHIFGQLHMTMATVLAGGALALQPRFSRSGFWAQVDRHGCTVFGGMANIIHFLWSDRPQDPASGRSLRLGIVASPPARLSCEFEQRFGIRFVDSYGMTEVEPVLVPQRGAVAPRGSCGRPSPDFEVALLDDSGRMSVDGAATGELLLRPRSRGLLFHGYEGEADATVELWRDLWFHTGDLLRRDAEGWYYLVERIGHVIRTGGENVSAAEVEAVVAEHPKVRSVAALGVAHEVRGHDVKVVVVLDGELPPEELWRFCRSRMARFMVPRFVEVRAELPYLPAGKLDRRALEQPGPGLWDAEAAGA